MSRQAHAPAPVSDGKLGGADRVLAVLKRLAQHPHGVRLDTLSDEMGAPKASVHRALKALSRAGLAEQDGRGGRYRLGIDMIRLAFDYYDRWDEQLLVRGVLEELSRRFGEVAHYARLDGPDIVCLGKVVPHGWSTRITSMVGGRNPAHCTAVGKVLLAHVLLTSEAVEDFIAEHGALVQRTPHTLTTAPALNAEFAAIRAQGYAVDQEESEVGIVCVAFPVYLGQRDRPSRAISVTALAHRTPLSALITRTDEIRTELGTLGSDIPQAGYPSNSGCGGPAIGNAHRP